MADITDSRKRRDTDDRFAGMVDASAFALAVEVLAGLGRVTLKWPMVLYAALLYMPEGSDWMTSEVREEHRGFGAGPTPVLPITR